ncbi:MAG: DUF4907 domain-containing protein [Bacteroidia bacterium]
MNTPTLRSFALLLFLGSFWVSCSNNRPKDRPVVQQTPESPANVAEMPAPPPVDIGKMKARIYEVKDSVSGKSLGWGYDIIFEGGGKVHQPTIPGLPGFQYFKTEGKAKKTADFALAKIRHYGGLTGITTEELDSLDVIK